MKKSHDDHDESNDDILNGPDYKSETADHKGFNMRNIVVFILVLVVVGLFAAKYTSIGQKKARKQEDIDKETNKNLQAATVTDVPGVSQLPTRYDAAEPPPSTPNPLQGQDQSATGQSATVQPGNGRSTYFQKQSPPPREQRGQLTGEPGQPAQPGQGDQYEVPAPGSAPGSAPGPKSRNDERRTKKEAAKDEAHQRQMEAAKRTADLLERVRAGGLTFSSSSKGSNSGDAAKTAQQRPTPTMGEVKMPVMPEIKIPGLGGDTDPSKQAEKQKYLDRDRSGTKHRVLAQYVDPITPYQIMAGTIIPGTFITGIDSDLPGQIIGQVRENVYDTVRGRFLLIPQGTKILGEYSNAITPNQEGLLVIWTRLILPTGRSINLEGMPGVDLSGYAGTRDQVNRHFLTVASAAVLSSLMGAGVNIAAGNSNQGQSTFGQLAAGGAATKMQTAGDKVLEKFINQPPTITIRPGAKFNVFVNNDLALQPYRR